MDKIMQFLFTDPVTAAGGGAGKAETFHYYVPWIIFCALCLLVPAYYWLEARKRFFGRNALHKYLLDRFMGQIVPIGLVGFFLMAFRFALDDSLFAWRFWRYAWGLWAVGIAGYWAFYFAVRYKAQRAAYQRQRTLQKYHPQPRRKTARASTR